MRQKRPPTTGVILAGGNSRRMGQNKAFMSLGGRRLIDRVIGVLREVFTTLLLVTNTPGDYVDLAVPIVKDVYPHQGSLGGLYSAIYHALTPYCLVVACDMPFLNAAVMRYLLDQIADYDVVMPDIHGDLQPLHAIYSKACLQPILRCLKTRRLKIVGFLPEVRARTVSASELQPLDPDLLTFHNLNTPAAFQTAEQRLVSWHRNQPL